MDLDFFLRAGSQGRGVPAEIRDAFVAAGGQILPLGKPKELLELMVPFLG